MRDCVTIEDFIELVDVIKNRNLISDYCLKREMWGKHALGKIINFILPEVYSCEELEDYFYDVLIKIKEKEESWQKPVKTNMFEIITGFKDFAYINTCFNLAFAAAYDDFSKFDYCPDFYLDELLEAIDQGEPLIKLKQEYEEKYLNCFYPGFYVYLEKVISPLIGKQKLEEYFEKVVQNYIYLIDDINIKNLNNQTVFRYIFGENIGRLSFTETVKKEVRNGKDKNSCIHYLILKAIFPFTVFSYRKNERIAAYELLEYSKEEINVMEEKAEGFHKASFLKESNEFYGDIKDIIVQGYCVEDLLDYINDYFDYLLKTERIMPCFTQFLKQLSEHHCDDEKLSKVLKSIKGNTRAKEIFKKRYNEQLLKAYEYLLKTNKNQKIKNKDKFVFYFLVNNVWKVKEVDLSHISNCELKEDLIEYLFYVEKKYNIYKTDVFNNYYPDAISFIDYVLKNYDICSVYDILEWHVLSYLSYLDVEKKLKPATIAGNLSGIRKFFDFISNEMDEDFLSPIINVSVLNITDHKTPTPIIPDDILLFLDNNISKIKQKDTALIYRLLSETGWRFRDVIKLKPSDILKEKENSEMAIVRVSTNKTRKARIIHGLGDIIESFITLDLYNDICKYIEDTKRTREKLSIETIFYTIKNGKPVYFEARMVDLNINTFLKENKIISINENYTVFTTRQTRKTVASNLISNNAPLAAIQKQLGHVKPETTVKTYAEVSLHRLSEANHEFYEKKFDKYFDKEKLRLFTEEERKILYIDFVLGHRDTELGVCSKHPSEGRCIYLGQKSCATCPKLCTGKAYLEQWETLKTQAEEIVSSLIKKYQQENIPEEEYQNFIEYKQEKELYQKYESVVEAIRKGKK